MGNGSNLSALRNLTGLIGMPELIPFWNVKKG